MDIHGGGFILGRPLNDDRFCSNFSNDNNILVVSLDYPKTRSDPFPSAVHALVVAVKAVLKDESPSFDRKKVAIGGFSAGANLSFGVSQNDDLQCKIGGIVSYYAPLDFTVKTSEKLKTRPANAGPDPLEVFASLINWVYISPGQDLMDPLLSVPFAPKARLPPKIYLFGCELDMLCRESEVIGSPMTELKRMAKGVICGKGMASNGKKSLGKNMDMMLFLLLARKKSELRRGGRNIREHSQVAFSRSLQGLSVQV